MNSRGFTVMEILVALFIFSIVFLPLTELLVADSKFEKKYEQKQEAMLVAKNEIEKAKRCCKKTENRDYQVTSAGKTWNVGLVVEEKELAQVPGQKTQQTQQINTGETSVLGQSMTSAPTAISKQFITVRVSRDKDTDALAEFRVMKETYK